MSMSIKKRAARAFTLVEILIVVVILGILAAIVIPQFTSASQSAMGANLLSQLQSIRSQLELFQVQHNGNYPTLAQLGSTWDVFVNKTDVTGTDMPATPVVGVTYYGPYMQKPPTNPFTGSATCVAAAASGNGWMYTAGSGAIKAIVPAATATAQNFSTTDVATY